MSDLGFTVGHENVSITYEVVKEKHTVIGEIGDVFSFSDEEIIDLVHETDDGKHLNFDEDTLFNIVENILSTATATKVTNGVVQGRNIPHEDNIKNTGKFDFRVPLCTIKSISSELSCKDPGQEIETALVILHKLSNYNWEAKAVLTLAAFTYDYGDIWHLANHGLFQSDALAKQFALLKNVPQLIETVNLQKHQQEVLELNNLIKTTMRVIKKFDEFDQLSKKYGDRIKTLRKVFDNMPADVFWAIATIGALATNISILTSNEPDTAHDLARYSNKISFILNKLDKLLPLCYKERAEIEAYNELCKLISTPTEITKIFKVLIFPKETTEQTIFFGSTNNTVKIDVLKKTNLFLFFSTLDITDKDVDRLRLVYDLITKEIKDKSYKIVWIPIVNEWTAELKKKFDEKIEQYKMPWYIVQGISPIAGIRYVKEQWHFTNNPILVVMNSLGSVLNTNAISLIDGWGMEAFPFDKDAEGRTLDKIKSVPQLIATIDATIHSWLTGRKYIFFYGGKDDGFIQNFHKGASAFKKETNIAIEIFGVGKTGRGGEDSSVTERFWNRIKNLFINKKRKVEQKSELELIKDLVKLLPYENGDDWVVFSQASTVITVGSGSIAIKVLEDVDNWKEAAAKTGFDFGVAFKDHYHKLSKELPHCHSFNLAIGPSEIIYEDIKCPDCDRIMNTYITYKCCPTHQY